MSHANRRRDELVEDRRLKLQTEKISVVRKEGRIQVMLDGSQIKRVVLEPRVVAHNQECNHREEQDRREISRGPIGAGSGSSQDRSCRQFHLCGSESFPAQSLQETEASVSHLILSKR